MKAKKHLLSDEEYSILTETKNNKIVSKVILYEKNISIRNFITELYKRTGTDLSYMYAIDDDAIGKCELEIKITLTKN